MLARHCCMRVHKEALPLINAGHDVHLIAEQATRYSEQYATVSLYQDQNQLYNAIRLHKDADVFHAHNEPSWFVTAVKDCDMRAPVILDMHDSNLIRKTPDEEAEELEHNPQAGRVSVDERNNAQLADGLVYPCQPMKDAVEREFTPKGPGIVVPSMLPKSFLRFDFDTWIGGLVYEGRIDTDNELKDQPRWRSIFQYSNYLEVARKTKAKGVPFHIYTARQNDAVRAEYAEVAILHEPKNSMDRLVRALGRHDWGLVGNLNAHTEWKNALPNKLFEYMAGCTPIVAMHADECAKLINEYGIGIVVESVDELAARWAEHRKCREKVVKYRGLFTMESKTPELEKHYARVIEEKRSMGAVVSLKSWPGAFSPAKETTA